MTGVQTCALPICLIEFDGIGETKKDKNKKTDFFSSKVEQEDLHENNFSTKSSSPLSSNQNSQKYIIRKINEKFSGNSSPKNDFSDKNIQNIEMTKNLHENENENRYDYANEDKSKTNYENGIVNENRNKNEIDNSNENLLQNTNFGKKITQNGRNKNSIYSSNYTVFDSLYDGRKDKERTLLQARKERENIEKELFSYRPDTGVNTDYPVERNKNDFYERLYNTRILFENSAKELSQRIFDKERGRIGNGNGKEKKEIILSPREMDELFHRYVLVRKYMYVHSVRVSIHVCTTHNSIVIKCVRSGFSSSLPFL